MSHFALNTSSYVNEKPVIASGVDKENFKHLKNTSGAAQLHLGR